MIRLAAPDYYRTERKESVINPSQLPIPTDMTADPGPCQFLRAFVRQSASQPVSPMQILLMIEDHAPSNPPVMVRLVSK